MASLWTSGAGKAGLEVSAKEVVMVEMGTRAHRHKTKCTAYLGYAPLLAVELDRDAAETVGTAETAVVAGSVATAVVGVR